MMSRLLRRFRMLVPPSSALIVYAFAYLVANLPYLFWLRAGNLGVVPDSMSYGRRTVLVFGLVVYGGYRAFGFHPYFRSGYRKWLESTPWDWRKPLPVGPAAPVIEDALVVAAMSAPAWWFGDFEFLSTYCIALGAYLMALSLTFPKTGAWGFHVVVMFAVGLAVRLWEAPSWMPTTAILLAYVFGIVGLGRSLKHWPWTAAACPTWTRRRSRRWSTTRLPPSTSSGGPMTGSARAATRPRPGRRRPTASSAACSSPGGSTACSAWPRPTRGGRSRS